MFPHIRMSYQVCTPDRDGGLSCVTNMLPSNLVLYNVEGFRVLLHVYHPWAWEVETYKPPVEHL